MLPILFKCPNNLIRFNETSSLFIIEISVCNVISFSSDKHSGVTEIAEDLFHFLKSLVQFDEPQNFQVPEIDITPEVKTKFFIRKLPNPFADSAENDICFGSVTVGDCVNLIALFENKKQCEKAIHQKAEDFVSNLRTLHDKFLELSRENISSIDMLNKLAFQFEENKLLVENHFGLNHKFYIFVDVKNVATFMMLANELAAKNIVANGLCNFLQRFKRKEKEVVLDQNEIALESIEMQSPQIINTEPMTFTMLVWQNYRRYILHHYAQGN